MIFGNHNMVHVSEHLTSIYPFFAVSGFRKSSVRSFARSVFCRLPFIPFDILGFFIQPLSCCYHDAVFHSNHLALDLDLSHSTIIKRQKYQGAACLPVMTLKLESSFFFSTFNRSFAMARWLLPHVQQTDSSRFFSLFDVFPINEKTNKFQVFN